MVRGRGRSLVRVNVVRPSRGGEEGLVRSRQEDVPRLFKEKDKGIGCFICAVDRILSVIAADIMYSG
jgi:hypothetical protein